MTIKKYEQDIIIENLKKAFDDMIEERAAELADSDDEAQAEIQEQVSLNSDCGGTWEYEDLSGFVRLKLEAEAEDRLFGELADVLGEKSDVYKQLHYIYNNAMENKFICQRCEHEFYESEENNKIYCKQCQPHAGI